jgi:phosphoglycolate phosphatase
VAYREHYGEIGLHMAVLYPGVADAVRDLSSRARCFVATSKRSIYAVRIVEGLGLADAFRGVYGTEPDGSLDDKADLIAALLRTEALDPRETVMVGDRSHDMLGARANAVRAVGALWGYGSRDELQAAGADVLVASPQELPKLA